jgi:hypothetical protein
MTVRPKTAVLLPLLLLEPRFQEIIEPARFSPCANPPEKPAIHGRFDVIWRQLRVNTTLEARQGSHRTSLQ